MMQSAATVAARLRTLLPRSVRLLALVMLATATACARPSRSPTPTTALRRCEGDYIVSVINNAENKVDVWASTPTGPLLIGTVSARTSAELVGPPSAIYVYWKWTPDDSPKFRPEGEVIYRTHCR